MEDGVMQLLHEYGACDDGYEWLAGQPDARTAWGSCQDHDDMCWMIRRLLVGRPERPLSIARELLARGLVAARMNDPRLLAVLQLVDAYMVGEPIPSSLSEVDAVDAALRARPRLDRRLSRLALKVHKLLRWIAYRTGSLYVDVNAAAFVAWSQLSDVVTLAACILDARPADLLREYITYEELAVAAGIEAGPAPSA